MTDRRPILLDGGMGKALQLAGAPFRQPEWSALALMEQPDAVRSAHEAFVAAGADVIITSNYAVVPFHLGAERFAERGSELTDLAGELARDAADAVDREVLVAGSLPPLFGSYEPDLFDANAAPPLLEIVASALAPHVDIFLAETQSCLAEADASLSAASVHERPLWVAFGLADSLVGDTAAMHSGESIADAVALAESHGCEAILFNCAPPEIMDSAIGAAMAARSGAIEIGAYANSFEPKADGYAANDVVLGLREDLHDASYRVFVEQWIAGGATIVGGCCGIMASHIAELRHALDSVPS